MSLTTIAPIERTVHATNAWLKERKREDFLAHITAALRESPGIYPEGVAWGVFKVLGKHVSAGEIGDIKSILPAAIRALWPETEDPHGS
jgi:uncharacterized protein (DUF2267 family)